MDNLEEIRRPQITMLAQSLRGRVLELALDARGCRLVQRALELADDYQQVHLMEELKGHIREALESPHANHVLQRAIELMRPSAVKFVLPELAQWGKPAALARHRYGCRVLERLIEHFPPMHLAGFLTEVLEDALELCRHVYGNFVMQHVLEHGEQAHRRRIIDVLCSDLSGAALDQHACSVLDKALSYGAIEDQQQLAEQVLKEPGLLAAMANMRGGFAATQRLFKVVEGPLLDEARTQLVSQAQEIQRTKHGRALICTVLPDYNVQPMPSVPSPARVRAHAPSRFTGLGSGGSRPNRPNGGGGAGGRSTRKAEGGPRGTAVTSSL